MYFKDHDFGIKNGHSPIADKVVCIDYDGTIFPWGPLMGEIEPLPGAVEAIKALKNNGYTIVIFTSRLSLKWLYSAFPAIYTESYYDQYKFVVSRLACFDIPYDEITAEKLPAEYYIDDKAIEFKNNWKEIQERLQC